MALWRELQGDQRHHPFCSILLREIVYSRKPNVRCLATIMIATGHFLCLLSLTTLSFSKLCMFVFGFLAQYLYAFLWIQNIERNKNHQFLILFWECPKHQRKCSSNGWSLNNNEIKSTMTDCSVKCLDRNTFSNKIVKDMDEEVIYIK